MGVPGDISMTWRDGSGLAASTPAARKALALVKNVGCAVLKAAINFKPETGHTMEISPR
jgi:hypothetical protein